MRGKTTFRCARCGKIITAKEACIIEFREQEKKIPSSFGTPWIIHPVEMELFVCKDCYEKIKKFALKGD